MMNVAEMKTQHAGDDIERRLEVVPTLIIALHPDLDRVGESAPLLGLASEGRDYLSRNRPDFAYNGHAAMPLNEARISRSPIIVQQDDEETYRIRGHSTSTKVEIYGRAKQSEYLLSVTELSYGVVVTLNKTVVLILKLMPLRDIQASQHSLLKGLNPDIKAISGHLEHIASLNLPVMIRGAAGTGKELTALQLHQTVYSEDKPFVCVNLAAIHDAVAEEELFGGYFGTQPNAGYFAQADGGTLVLEDLEDASERVIGLLFKVLTKGYYLTKDNQTAKPINCRLILTSIYESCPYTEDSRLQQLANHLCAYQVFLPALTDRMEDISLLFTQFVREQWQRLYPEKDWALEVPVELISQLLTFNWPGNVRQLRNVARQVVIDSRESSTLQLDTQLLSILRPRLNGAASKASGKASAANRKPNTINREELLDALQKNRFELQATATELNISRASVYQLIQRFDGIQTAQDISEQQLRDSYKKHHGDTEQMMWQLQVSQVGMRRRLKALGLDI
ncbi:MAG: sigma 54-interacting transcriptional regulator [Pseudomonadota bacterium]